jgi:hypothetical protein
MIYFNVLAACLPKFCNFVIIAYAWVEAATTCVNYPTSMVDLFSLLIIFMVAHYRGAQQKTLRQRRVAASNGLGTGLSTTIKYVRRTASGAAGNGLGITIKYLRRLKEWLFGQRPGHHDQVPVTNNCRGQLPGNHD